MNQEKQNGGRNSGLEAMNPRIVSLLSLPFWGS
jgi:hypothetical protein